MVKNNNNLHLFVQSLIANMHRLRRHVDQIFPNNLPVYLSSPCCSHQDRMHSDCPTCVYDSHAVEWYPLNVEPTFRVPHCAETDVVRKKENRMKEICKKVISRHSLRMNVRRTTVCTYK